MYCDAIGAITTLLLHCHLLDGLASVNYDTAEINASKALGNSSSIGKGFKDSLCSNYAEQFDYYLFLDKLLAKIYTRYAYVVN